MTRSWLLQMDQTLFLPHFRKQKTRELRSYMLTPPANVEAEATFSTDNKAAGTTAGEEMKKALEDAGITSGKIGVINVNAATDSCVNREEGFRAAFDGTDFEIMGNPVRRR